MLGDLQVPGIRYDLEGRIVRFSIFSVTDHYPDQPRGIAKFYHQLLDEIVPAEELGFEAFFVAEHHFQEYGIVPAPPVLLGADRRRRPQIVAWCIHRWHSRPVSTPPPTPTDPAEETAGHRLLLALLTISRRLKPRTSDGRLDRASVAVLHYVSAKAPLRLSELAKCMGLDSSTVSRHVSHLEEGGYLTRSGDPDDRRASRVLLTGKGRAILDEATRAQAAIVDQAVADWPEEDRDRLTSLMTRLASSVDQMATETETTR
jgi:DNA-binding MarR family transcriptional regulator